MLGKCAQGRPCILIVDDERSICDVLSKLFRGQGWEPIVAHHGLEACRLYEKYRKRIDVALIDVTMPGMTGIEVFMHLYHINHQVKVILTTGYSKIDRMPFKLECALCDFIKKPFQSDEIIDTVKKYLRDSSDCAPHLSREN